MSAFHVSLRIRETWIYSNDFPVALRARAVEQILSNAAFKSTQDANLETAKPGEAMIEQMLVNNPDHNQDYWPT